MIRKIVYGILSVIIITAFVLLLRLKLKKEPAVELKQTTQTIIPAASSQAEDMGISSDSADAKIFIELYKDEAFIEAFSVDLNADGTEDQVVVVKKLLDPFVYLILSVQDSSTFQFLRVAEIRTGVTQPKSLSFYAIYLENSLPVIVYSGMASDNSQLLVIQSIAKDSAGALTFNVLADLHADVQIQLNNKKSSAGSSLSDYEIYTYDSDPSLPDTLNQIKRTYKWNKTRQSYVKAGEIKIPGEKIEMQLLRKLQNGNAASFKEFLSGLWYQPNSSGKESRYLYFGTDENILIFHIGNIEEIYNVNSVLPRRYGVYLTTNNKSISSIHRRIDIDLRGVDEINVRVIEDVARLKIRTASNWDGVYRKKSDAQIQSADNPVNRNTDEIGVLFANTRTEWTDEKGGFFKTDNFSYELKTHKDIQKGRFIFNMIGKKNILQLKAENGDVFFYLAEIGSLNKRQTLKLTQVSVLLNKITPAGNEALTFELKSHEHLINQNADNG